MSNQANLDKKAREAMIEFLKNDDEFIDYTVNNIDGYSEDDACAKFAEGDFSVEEFVSALQIVEDEIFEADDCICYPYKFLPEEQYNDHALLVSFDENENIVSIEHLEL